MRRKAHVPFGKGPTEKDLNHGHLAGGLLHLTGGSWKRSHERTRATEKNNPTGNHGTQRLRDLQSIKTTAPVPDPPMEMSGLEAKYLNDLDGLILLSYGPGNVPEDPRFISMIERLVRDGTIVANVTKFPFGRVELKLFETSAILFDLGVIDAYGMTLEAAYTKLLWAIARRDNRKRPGVQ
jgi:L-asparaginase/Glu-tRNA(Gln) amidotransferase subunit D